MDWVAALCLSVPPSLALWLVVNAALREWRSISNARNFAVDVCVDTAAATFRKNGRQNRERARAAEKYARKTALLVAEIEAEAAVKCARYGAKVIRPKPPKDPMKPITAHDRWLAGDGRKLPESVQLQVEWAVGRLRGVESDEQGDEEDAVSILDSLAPGLAESTKDEVRRAAGASV